MIQDAATAAGTTTAIRQSDPVLTLNVNVPASTASCSDAAASSSSSSADNEDDNDSLPPAGRLSTLTDLCFFPSHSGIYHQPATTDDSSSTTSSISSVDDDAAAGGATFQCQLALLEDTNQQQQQHSVPLLSDRLLGTCHSGGECCIWDLGQRRKLLDVVTTTSSSSTYNDHGVRPGLALRRLSDDEHRFFYQTRDPAGTISLYDLNRPSSTTPASITTAVSQFHTESQSFCAAAPCYGNPNLMVTPFQDLSMACVRDWRVSPRGTPVALFHAVQGIVTPSSFLASSTTSNSTNVRDQLRRHGMLMSLAMTTAATPDYTYDTNHAASTPSTVIACGMESGIVTFHDLAMLRSPLRVETTTVTTTTPGNSILLDSEAPILSVDVSWSRNMTHSMEGSSLVAVAGLASSSSAGEGSSVADPRQQGRVAVIKVRQKFVLHDNNNDLGSDNRDHQTSNAAIVTWEPRLRTRLPLSSTTANHQRHPDKSHRKRGAAVCRFRPDGRVVAVGGWDHRVHLYDRASRANGDNSGQGKLAILRGHTESVRALDWAPDADTSGLLATGSGDGWVHVWQYRYGN